MILEWGLINLEFSASFYAVVKCHVQKTCTREVFDTKNSPNKNLAGAKREGKGETIQRMYMVRVSSWSTRMKQEKSAENNYSKD